MMEAPSALPEFLSSLASTPNRDIAATSFAAVGSLVWVRIFDTLADKGILDRKLSRKLVHTTTGPLFLLTWPLFSDAPYAQYLAAIVPALNAVKLFAIGSGLYDDPAAVKSISREGDRTELLRGPLYYCLTMVAATAFCWRGSAVGFTSLALMCGGDGLADIVGRRLGKGNPLPFNPQKSYAGSIAMLLGGWSLSLLFVYFYSYLGYFSADVASLATPLFVIALACTILEALPINQYLDDNFSVPALAWVLGLALLPPAAAAVSIGL